MGMADDAAETPVAYGPNPGRREPHAALLRLQDELVCVDAEIDAWAAAAHSADDEPPVELLRRKFWLHQLLNPTGPY